MQQSDFRLPAADGAAIFVRSFLPDGASPRGVVQVAHGMAEHSARYGRFAQTLTDHGYALYVNDHRGHGYTAGGREELGHFADSGGWNKVVSDQVALFQELGSRHPSTPRFLMGHSMGSYIARGAATRVSGQLAGLILSSTSHDKPRNVRALRLIAVAERMRLGKRGKSAPIRWLSFDSYNRRIDDPRTTCDWLSRDPFEVDKYIADPLCGYDCTTQLWCDLLGGMARIFAPNELRKLPANLPIYIMAGEHDPINNRLASIKKLHQALEAAGLRDVTLRVYQGARHELLNETNREEVTRDLVHWLDERLA